jgi:hypothetical protein
MCTVGGVFHEDGRMLLFKTMDAIKKCPGFEPTENKGEKYKYLKFRTGKDPSKPGFWAGINEKGVCILGADGNELRNFKGEGFGSFDSLLRTYDITLGNAKDVYEGIEALIYEYQTNHVGGNGDIVLLADTKDLVIIEYAPDEWGIKFRWKEDYIVRTNFFTVLRHLRPSPEENSLHMSSARRHARALDVLSRKSKKTTKDDVIALMRDHEVEPPSAITICRHGGDNEYKTQNSILLEVDNDKAVIHYQLNGYPCKSDYKTMVYEFTK